MDPSGKSPTLLPRNLMYHKLPTTSVSGNDRQKPEANAVAGNKADNSCMVKEPGGWIEGKSGEAEL